VLGCAGSGKTTFAHRLAARLNVPAYCLDYFWQPDWSTEEVPKFRDLLRTLHAADAWVSDGNFASVTFDIRLPRADLIVWIDRPRFVCVWRAVRRVFRTEEAHKLRDLPKVLRFIEGFDRQNRPLIEGLRVRYAPQVPVVHLKSDHESACFIEGYSSIN
jgi:adenylate kinase family enzyme